MRVYAAEKQAVFYKALFFFFPCSYLFKQFSKHADFTEANPIQQKGDAENRYAENDYIQNDEYKVCKKSDDGFTEFDKRRFQIGKNKAPVFRVIVRQVRFDIDFRIIDLLGQAIELSLHLLDFGRHVVYLRFDVEHVFHIFRFPKIRL